MIASVMQGTIYDSGYQADRVGSNTWISLRQYAKGAEIQHWLIAPEIFRSDTTYYRTPMILAAAVTSADNAFTNSSVGGSRFVISLYPSGGAKIEQLGNDSVLRTIYQFGNVSGVPIIEYPSYEAAIHVASTKSSVFMRQFNIGTGNWVNSTAVSLVKYGTDCVLQVSYSNSSGGWGSVMTATEAVPTGQTRQMTSEIVNAVLSDPVFEASVEAIVTAEIESAIAEAVSDIEAKANDLFVRT